MIPIAEILLALMAILIFFSEGLKEYAEKANTRYKRILAKGVSKWIEVIFLGALISIFFKEFVNAPSI